MKNKIIIVIVLVLIIASGLAVYFIKFNNKDTKSDNNSSSEETKKDNDSDETQISTKECVLHTGFNKTETEIHYNLIRIELYNDKVHSYTKYRKYVYYVLTEYEEAIKEQVSTNVYDRDSQTILYQNGPKEELNQEVLYDEFIKEYTNQNYICD